MGFEFRNLPNLLLIEEGSLRRYSLPIMQKIHKRKAIVSLISSYASQFATTGANLATKLIVARLIAPADLGLYAKALFIQMFCETVMDMGVTQHIAREDHRPYGTYLLLRVSLAVVLIAGIELWAGRIGLWDGSIPPVVRMLIVVLLIKSLSGVPNLYLDRELMIHRSVVPQLLRLLSTGVVSIGLARMGMGVWALVYGTITGELVFAATMWQAAWGRMPIRLSWEHAGSLIWGSKYLFLIAIMGFALQQGSIAITGTLLTNQEVGYYAMASSLVIILSRVVEAAVYRVIYPLFCEYSDNLHNLGRLFRRATLAVYAVEAPVYFYVCLYAPVVVPLVLGRKWWPAAALMQALSVAGIVNPLCTFGSEILRAKKYDGMLTFSNIVSAVTLMGAGYFLTRRFGAMGMVAANYVIIGAIPVVVVLLRLIREDVYRLVWQLAFVYAASLAGLMLAGRATEGHRMIQALVGMAVIPGLWMVFYRVFFRELGSRTLGELRSPVPEEVELGTNA